MAGGFTARAGGHSAPPYDSLNLGTHVGDDPQSVAANRAELAAQLGTPIVYLDQVHSADVIVAGRADLAAPPHPADGAVTRERGLGLAIMTADCAPVLLFDPAAGVIGAAHAGRPGLLAGILPAVVAAMAELGAHARDICAHVGPTVCGRCYEVPEQMAKDADRILPGSACRTARGTPGIDIPGAASAQLRALGLAQVVTSGTCTLEDPQSFSHRRERPTGRMAAVITLKGV